MPRSLRFLQGAGVSAICLFCPTSKQRPGPDVGESHQMIGFIELLVKDWYILCHDREEWLKSS